MFLLLVCFSFVLSAYNAGSTVNHNLIAPYVEYDPIIDGELDEEWTFPANEMSVYEVKGGAGAAATQHENHSSYFQIAWNENGFYFWGNVIDDIIYTEGANSYEQDCFEIYFDGGDEDAAAYDENDIQWRYVYGLDADSAGWCDLGTAGECAWVETETGYSFELALPTEVLVKEEAPLFDLVAGTEIGFEVQCADNDTGARDGITKWWNIDGTSWQQPLLFGNVYLGGDGAYEDEIVADFIEEMEFAPVVDAENDDWEGTSIVTMPIVESWQMADGGYQDFKSYYRAGWNAEGFYFFGHVMDQERYTEGANSYEQDCFEIYFDGGNEKAASYDANDIQWRYVYGITTDSAGWCDLGTSGECAWIETDVGYDFELALPTEVLVKEEAALFTLAEGTVIGWEVQCADNDTGARDAIAKWWNMNGNSWQEPLLFGTAELVATGTEYDMPETPGVEEPVAANAIDLSVPSIITSASAAVSLSVPGTVSLYNVAGQEVKSVNAAGNVVDLDVSDLANGVYLVNLKAGNGSATKKITLLK
jgi:hypothetical protein